MIRDFIPSDLPEIIHILRKGSLLSVDDILKQFKYPVKLVVYHNKRVMGAACVFTSNDKYYGKKVTLLIYADPNEEVNEIRASLFASIWNEVIKMAPNIVVSHYQDKDMEELFIRNGFELWYSWSTMKYYEDLKDESTLDIRMYEDSEEGNYLRKLKKAFYSVRRDNSIIPYCIEDDEKIKGWLRKYKASTYLLYENNELIGSSMLKNDEVDCVFISPEFQGRGYGKKLMNYTINKAIESGIQGLKVCVFNKGGATSFYKSLGFKITQTNTTVRIIIKQFQTLDRD